MKSLYYPAWEKLEIRDVASPGFSAGEVLVQVAACGICGSELETFKSRSERRPPPLIMGHEFCGTIVEVNSSSSPFRKNQKVISHSIVTCGECRPCRRGEAHLCERRGVFGMHRQGAFAEFVNVPTSSLIPWPDGLSPEAACLAEPLANGVHVANRLKPHRPKLVVVLGAGPIGLMCEQAVQVLLDCKTFVSDMIPERLEVAAQLGATCTVHAKSGELVSTVSAATEGEGADAVIDAVGSALTKQLTFQLVRPGGAVVWIGLHENTISFDSYSVTLPEKTVYGSYAATLEELREAVELMRAGRVDVQSWVQTFPLDDGVNAFQRMLQGKCKDIKGVLLP